MSTKKCTKCGEDKPLDRFARNTKYSDSFRSVCKDCTNKQVLAYRQKKRDELRQRLAVPFVATPEESLYTRETYVPPKWGR